MANVAANFNMADKSCHYMFVRFRQGGRRLQLSLVETRREGDKVRHEHVASLGAARLPLSPESRLEFWEKLFARLARLENWLDSDGQAKVLAAVHTHIPMVTGDERHALQLEAAKDEARFWEVMQEANEEMSVGHRALARTAEAASVETKEAAEDAAKHVAAARDRIARLERGEEIGGTTKTDLRQLFRNVGLTDSDMRHWGNVARIRELGAEQEYLDATAPDARSERRIARKIMRMVEHRKLEE